MHGLYMLPFGSTSERYLTVAELGNRSSLGMTFTTAWRRPVGRGNSDLVDGELTGAIDLNNAIFPWYFHLRWGRGTAKPLWAFGGISPNLLVITHYDNIKLYLKWRPSTVITEAIGACSGLTCSGNAHFCFLTVQDGLKQHGSRDIFFSSACDKI